MKMFFALMIVFLVGCSDDPSPVPRVGIEQTPPAYEPTGEHNISLDSFYLLPISTLTEDDLNYWPEIMVTNHSATEYMFFYIHLTDNGFTRAEKTVILNPNESRDIAIDLYKWMGGKTGNHHITVTLDYDDEINETNETDNALDQYIYIIPPAAG